MARERLIYRTEIKSYYGVTNSGMDYYTSRQCRVYYNPDWQEYVTKTYVDGKHYEPADYFDSDKESCISHADYAIQIEP